MATKTNPFISVVIPFHDHAAILAECLGALAKQTNKLFEVILVNNNSGNEAIWLAKSFTSLNLKILNLQKNMLYSVPVNKGFEQARGDLILFLNSDVIVSTDYFSNLMEAFKEEEGLLCANGILYSHGGRIDTCGLKSGLSMRPIDLKSPKIRDVLGPSGAAFCLRKTLCERLIREWGFILDPEIPFFYSDLDLAFRLQKMGVRTKVLPLAKGLHRRGGSIPGKVRSVLPFRFVKLPREYKILLLENRLAFLKKWKAQIPSSHKPFILAYDFLCRFFIFLDRKE